MTEHEICLGDFIPTVEELAKSYGGIHVYDRIEDYSLDWSPCGAVLLDWEDLQGTFVVIEEPGAGYDPRDGNFYQRSDSLHLLIDDEEGTVYELSHADFSVEPLITVSGGVALRQWLTMLCPPDNGVNTELASTPFLDVFPSIYIPFFETPEQLLSTPIQERVNERLSAPVPAFAQIQAVLDLLQAHCLAGKRWLAPVHTWVNHESIESGLEVVAEISDTTVSRVVDEILSLHDWSASLSNATIKRARDLDPNELLGQSQAKEYLLLTPMGIECVSSPYYIPLTRFLDQTAVLEVGEGHCGEFLRWWLQSRDGNETYLRLRHFISTGDSSDVEFFRLSLPSRDEQIRTWVELSTNAEFLHSGFTRLAREARHPFRRSIGRDSGASVAEHVRNQHHQLGVLTDKLLNEQADGRS